MNIRFATKEEGQTLMGSSDEYTRSLNAYNLEWASKSKTEQEHLDKCRASVIEWSEEEQKKNLSIIHQFQSRLDTLGLLIDQEIILVKTNGSDCNGLPYTRGNFIVLPFTLKKDEKSVGVLDHFTLGLLVHETFHIISRKNPDLKPVLYELAGFNYPSNFNQEKNLPPRFITNPDALNLDFTIEVTHNNEKFLTTPVFEGFGNKLKLLAYSSDGNYLRWIKARKTDYLEKINCVSSYVIHPEEILAELFRVSITSREENALCENFLVILRNYFHSSK